jgi:hypothetical protein
VESILGRVPRVAIDGEVRGARLRPPALHIRRGVCARGHERKRTKNGKDGQPVHENLLLILCDAACANVAPQVGRPLPLRKAWRIHVKVWANFMFMQF